MRHATLLLIGILLLSAACERETRRFRDAPAAVRTGTTVRMSGNMPGTPLRDTDISSFYEENAYAIAQGKRLYSYFNCVGCHAHGGGGMGPPLMDDRWIYGSDPENIYATIVQGRPNGMPSFGGRIPADRVWWLVAYVRSLSGLTPKGARPGRDDDMQYKKPPSRLQHPERPRETVQPKPQ